MKNGWGVIVFAPVKEFMDTVTKLRPVLIASGISVLAVAFAIGFFVALHIVRPINTTVTAFSTG